MTTRIRVLAWPAFTNRTEQPYTSLLYEHMDAHVEEATTARIASGTYDILHLHWPDRRVRSHSAPTAFARSAGLIALLDLAHMRGMKVVWTVHNLAAHEGVQRERLETWYWNALTTRLDGFVSLSRSGADAVRERYAALRDTPAFIIPHGHYRGVYPDSVSREEARRTLGFDANARVVSFVGQIRDYKNVQRLAEVFRELRDENAILSLAGKPKPDSLGTIIKEAARQDPRIRFDPRFIPGDEMQLFLRAADLVVLPYRDILNSGSALLALSFDRPLLVPRKGAMAELAHDIGDDWVRTYDGELTSETLRDALAWATRNGRPVAPDLTGLDWARIAAQTMAAYIDLMTTQRADRS